jgi:endoglycosylceramidase
VAGGQIVDGAGRQVALRGFDASPLAAYPNPYSAGAAPLDDADARLLAASGFDVVRLAISWALLEPRRGSFDGAYLDRVQRTVSMLERHGLRVVLDMHMGIGWGAQAQVPAWASLPAVPDVRWFPIEPWTERISPRPVADEVHFWTSSGWQRDFVDAWRFVAGRFRDDPRLAGYDLFNEPHPLPMPPAAFEARYLWPFYARVIDGLSGVDPGHLFIVESTLWVGLPTATTSLRAPNLVYSPHLYSGSLIPDPRGNVAAAVSSELASRRREASRLPAAPWVGELGIDQGQPDAPAWTDSTLGALAAQHVGWTWWQWRQDGGWGIRSADGRRVDWEALRRLARPYVSASPSGVSSGPGAGPTELRIDAAPNHSGAPLLVGWPSATLGAPSVRGACLLGPPAPAGPGSYSLALVPGRGCTIEVRPERQ